VTVPLLLSPPPPPHSMFAHESPTPNIRTQPAKTLAAACYLAVLLLSDDNVSCSLAQLGENPDAKTDAAHELRLELGTHFNEVFEVPVLRGL